MKVFLYGVMAEENFGGPSLMHGAREIINKINPNSEIVCYQKTEVSDLAVSDMGFPVYEIPYKRCLLMFIDAIKYKIGIKPREKKCALFFYHLNTCDIVGNLFGICFCSNVDKGSYRYIKVLRKMFSKYTISIIGRLFGKKTVKCTSSYGPINSKYDVVSAKIAFRYIFNKMCCREKQSLKELKKAIGKKVDLIISPDMANMMPYIRSETVVERCIGVSVSYQIIKQWSSNESYIDCMVNSINHILRNTDCKVLLIPNETSSSLVYHDQHVAEEIFNHIDVCGRVFVLDISNMNSTRLKSAIGKCEILIASRYHSCVAGLSSGVPTLVIGWHYKYLELLEKYHQSQWIISSDSCTSWEIIHKFDILWKCRESEKQKILNRYNYVCHQIIDASKAIFTV